MKVRKQTIKERAEKAYKYWIKKTDEQKAIQKVIREYGINPTN